MAHDPIPEVQARLEQQVGRMLDGTAQFAAPHDLETQVLNSIERRARVPWWRRRVPEWPLLAQLAFAATGVAAAWAMVLARPLAPARLDAVIQRPVAVLQQPAADLHTTLNVLALFHRLSDTLAGSLLGSLPENVWYAGLVLCAAGYLALFFLIAFGYRLLQAPLASR